MNVEHAAARLPDGSEWSFEAIERYDEAISATAQRYGLDVYPHLIEIISADKVDTIKA